jgi:hypothetical protein
MDIQTCHNGGDIFHRVGSEGCEEAIRPSAGVGTTSGWSLKRPRRNKQTFRKVGTMMNIAYRAVREWILVVICAILVGMVLYPLSSIELYPVLDWKGGNQYNMETFLSVYRCGEVVKAQMIFQKQRNVKGVIRWMLVPNQPNGHVDIFTERTLAAPVGIYNQWVNIERLPTICAPGKYHFKGTMTYPLLFGQITYAVRTTCFEVK